MTTISIPGPERDALYDQLQIRIAAIDDVRLAVNNKDFARAALLSSEFSDLLRFITDDLGWHDGPSEQGVELKTPPEILRRILGRLNARADEDEVSATNDRAAVETLEDETRILRAACTTVLSQLDEADG
jgi:hypothetical protein